MSIRLPSEREEFKGFQDFYDSELAPYLKANEERRRRAVRQFAIVLPISLALAAGAFFLLPWYEVRYHAAFLIAVLGGGLAWAIVATARTRITHGLLSLVCTKLGFDYRGKLGRPDYCSDFDRLDLLPNYNRERWEDEVRGARNGTDFIVCEARLKRRSSGKRKSTKTVFHGQLVVIDYHKKFLGETVVKRDVGILNALTKPREGFQRVGLTSPKFEKIFEAWSTDQVEARELLDPLVLERFEALDALFEGAKLRAAFSDGRLLLALKTGDKLDVGSMFKSLEGPERVERILKEFDLIFDLIDALIKHVEGRLDGAFTIDAVKTG